MSFSTLLNADSKSLDFASLTPTDRRTAHGVQMVFEDVQDQNYDYEHHRKFFRPVAGAMAATRSPTFSPGPAELTEGLTTEADLSEDDEALPSSTPCYVFSLDNAKLPFAPDVGYWFGCGDLERFPHNGGVDLLLPAGNFENPGSSTSLIYARHGYFAFDPTHGQFFLHARHRGIRVGDRPLGSKSRILLPRRARISVGPHRFIFEFKAADEETFQTALRKFMATNHGQNFLNDATSATPSTNDVSIDDWVLHGVVGASATSVIHAATNMRSGEVVAVKRLRYGSSKKRAEREVDLYDDIQRSIEGGYLLWKPLARLGDFSQFGLVGQWRSTSQAVKKVLFVQIALGLSALHDAGWIHRDLKPANLGIIELDNAPKAVIMDEGAACEQKLGGCKPRAGTCGTVGYLAPELENVFVAPTYGTKVDIWSLGAVAYFVFVAGRIPWSLNFNMFMPSLNSQDPTLQVFRRIHANLLKQPNASIENLIAAMLQENPDRRPDIHEVLAHSALRSVRSEMDARIEASKKTGQKRSQDTLSCDNSW